MPKNLYKLAAIGGIWIGIAGSSCSGQLIDAFDVFDPRSQGLHLYGVGMSTMYYSTGYGTTPLSGVVNASGSQVVMLQSSAVMGWSKQTTKASVSIIYSPSYVRGVQSSNVQSFNHSLSMTANRTLGTKWTIDASIRGILMDFSQLLFGQGQYSNLFTSTPASFGDPSGGIGAAGGPEDQQLTQLFGALSTGAVPVPIVNSPETSYVYGARNLSVGLSTSLAYAYSTRSTIRLSLSANRSQYLSEGASGVSRPNYAIPRTTSGSADLNWSYSITPRTTTSFAVAETRTMSSIEDMQITRASVSIGRDLTKRWVVQVTAGAGSIAPVRATTAIRRGVQEEWGGNIGYKLGSHMFSAAISRSVADVYGLGANSTLSSNGAWVWRKPGRSIAIMSGFGFSRLIGPTFDGQPGSWQARVGINRSLSRYTSFGIAYSYVSYPRVILLDASQQSSQNGVVATLSWAPALKR